MKYTINSDKSKWKSIYTSKKDIYYLEEVDDRIGEVNIEFEYNSSYSKYVSKYTIIPLFLYEMNDFLQRVNGAKESIWTLGFSPFAYGMIYKNGMLISSMGGESFYSSAYDYMSFSQISDLKEQLIKDMRQYGKLKIEN